jgi:NADH-quinone oxidoreductase subunit L
VSPVSFALHSVMSAPLWFAISGVVAAWYFVLKRPDRADAIQHRFRWLYNVLANKYYFDWFNENVLAKLSRGLGVALWRGGDAGLIDGVLINGSANTIGRVAGIVRRIQSGYLYSYAFWMIVGLVLLLGWFLLRL